MKRINLRTVTNPLSNKEMKLIVGGRSFPFCNSPLPEMFACAIACCWDGTSLPVFGCGNLDPDPCENHGGVESCMIIGDCH